MVLATIVSMFFRILIFKLVGFLYNLFKLHVFTKRKLRKQGVSGPKISSWLTGNAQELRGLASVAKCDDMEVADHNLVPRLAPLEHKYAPVYGKRILAWSIGWEPSVSISEPLLVQEVLCSPSFEKSGIQNKFMLPLFGKGIIMANGKEWDAQRKLVHPAFSVDKIKGMQKIMNDCARDVVEKWSEQIKRSSSSRVEIEAKSTFNLVTADIIARTAFGNNYEKKEEYIRLEHELQQCVLNQSFFCLLPGYRYLPTKENRRIWQINKSIKHHLQELIDARLCKSADTFGSDILGLLLAAAVSPSQNRNSTKKPVKLNMSKELLIDECKCFFFAGHETSASLLTWAMMLLALNPKWQTEARQEVKQVLQSEMFPTQDMLPNLRIVGGILSETLRLYPPATRVRRRASKDTYIGSGENKLLIPKNVSVDIPILCLHHSKEIWGEDATQFNPQRFLQDGRTAGAGEYIPFGSGPRVCIGRVFSLTESKIILSVLLRSFEWELSPMYRHAPESGVTIYPKYGMPLLVSFADT